MNNIELKVLRNKNNITQDELAKLCNVSLRTIQNWEGGNIEIPKSKEKVLDNIFNKIAVGTNNTIFIIQEILRQIQLIQICLRNLLSLLIFKKNISSL